MDLFTQELVPFYTIFLSCGLLVFQSVNSFCMGRGRMSLGANLWHEKLLRSILADDTAAFLLERVLLLWNAFDEGVLLHSVLDVFLDFLTAFRCLKKRIRQDMSKHFHKFLQHFFLDFVQQDLKGSLCFSNYKKKTYQPPFQLDFDFELIHFHQSLVLVCQIIHIYHRHFLWEQSTFFCSHINTTNRWPWNI